MKARTTEQGGVVIFCPACKEGHRVWVPSPETPANVPVWEWNSNKEKPTISPSILVQGTKLVRDVDGKWTGEWERDANGNTIPTVCHSFVRDGMIQYLGDCTHDLAGQTVPLQDF